jgi:hypothetical protein
MASYPYKKWLLDNEIGRSLPIRKQEVAMYTVTQPWIAGPRNSFVEVAWRYTRQLRHTLINTSNPQDLSGLVSLCRIWSLVSKSQ